MLDEVAQIRFRVVSSYGLLAMSAAAGEQVIDCEPDSFAAGGFGPAGYVGTAGLPPGALRASMGCGNPVAVTGLQPGETVLDLGSGGGIDVLLAARRVGPAGLAYGLDGAAEMVELARANAARAGRGVPRAAAGRPAGDRAGRQELLTAPSRRGSVSVGLQPTACPARGRSAWKMTLRIC